MAKKTFITVQLGDQGAKANILGQILIGEKTAEFEDDEKIRRYVKNGVIQIVGQPFEKEVADKSAPTKKETPVVDPPKTDPPKQN